MIFGILFLFGLALGSFFNVVALRYDGEHFVFNPRMIGGRSHCPHCRATLEWFELVPLVSFLIQGKKCRHCGKSISAAYFFVELLTGLIFAGVPYYLYSFFPAASGVHLALFAGLWVAAFCLLLLLSYIDVLTGILPDELTIMFGIVAVLICVVSAQAIVPVISFFGPYAVLFGLTKSLWASRIIGALFGFFFFLSLFFVTRGRGMGMGDVKLALPLGLLFGWPDVFFVFTSAFLTGALVGVIAIIEKKKTMKGTLPFAPFLAFGAVSVFFLGPVIFGWYLHLIGI